MDFIQFLKLIFLFSIEPTVAHFLENESLKNKICCHLDDSNSGVIGNWKMLLELLNEKGILNKVNSSVFESHYYGGGSPTMVMLDCIMKRSPKSRLSDLIKRLKKIQRNDVALDLTTIMEERTNVELLEDLTMKDKQCLKKLDGRDKNWEYLAEQYGFTSEERKVFNSEEVRPNKWSPTKALLERAVSAKPKFLLKDLEAFLREMERNDLANVVNEFIENDIQRQQQHQQIKTNPLPQQHHTTSTNNNASITTTTVDNTTEITIATTSTRASTTTTVNNTTASTTTSTTTLSQHQMQQPIMQQPQQQELPQVQQSSAEPIQSSDESLQSSCFCWKLSS